MSTATPPPPTPKRSQVRPPAIGGASPLDPSLAEPWPVLPPYRLSLDQYHRIAEQGIIDPKEPAILIRGVLVRKMTKHTPHIIASNNLDYLLNRAIPEGWHVAMGNPIRLEESASEPEPDAAIVRGRPADHALAVAGPADFALLVEVAESSLRVDQTLMKALYAAARVAIYWIVNLVDRRIEVYTEPTGPDSSADYRHREDFGPGTAVPLVLEGREVARIAVDAILPPAPVP